MNDIKIPKCIGIILDGNRRWARERGLPTLKGHQKGYEKLKETVKWCKDAKVEHLAVYAFSTENWNRSEEEVAYLLDLFRTMLKEQLREISKNDVFVHIVGNIEMFPDDIQNGIKEIHDKNNKNAQFHLWICLSYGGRAEIVAGVNKLLKEKVESVTEEEFKKTLWTADMPDPDLIIRPGKEKRLSNFLTWSSVYSELFFIDTYWPDFSKDDFQKILNEYDERERRHGK